MDITLFLSTRNQGKVSELQQLMASYPITIRSLDEFPDCPIVVEDGNTFEGNAIKKAEVIAQFLHMPVLADDSGLEVEALGGKPGVYSARFAGPDATDADNNRKLVELMHDLPPGQRDAQFRCVLALAIPGQQTWTCEGACSGQIVLEEQGSGGFGYDPIFFLPQWGKTMAQLTKQEKNKISHRGQAMRKLIPELTRRLTL
jgi:XTP/dITP diphosphohydrolase